MYYKGVYTIKDVRNYNGGSWETTLVVGDFKVVATGYTPRGSMSKANRKMDKIMKYKRICDEVKEACVGNVQEHTGSDDS